MNTKTMRLPPRRVLTPTKRKERDDIHAPDPKPAKLLKPTAPESQSGSGEPGSSNQLLAGYLAHEYLTNGTLFGQPYDPAPSHAVPLAKPGKRARTQPSTAAEPSEAKKHQRYVEIASLLKTDGAHLAGVVNPTQLARFLHM